MNLSSLLGSVRKKAFAAPALRPARRRPRLQIDTLEAREVPAVLPAPVVDQQSFRAIDNDAWSFAMAVDPTNPNQIFGAYVTHAANGTRVGYKFSSNGGTTWSSLGWSENAGDPKHTDGTLFEDVSDPAVAWDRFGNVFVTYTEHHTDHTAGRLIVRKFQFSGTPAQVGKETTLYRWFDTTQAGNPNIAIDNNLVDGNAQGVFQDPLVSGPGGRQNDDLAAAQTDKDKVRVFVTWSTKVVDTGNAVPANTNPSAIIMRYSPDGGKTYSGSLLVNNDAYSLGGGPYVFSKTVFTPGRAGEVNSGGRMVTVYSSNSGGPDNQPTLKTDTILFTNTATALPDLKVVSAQGRSIRDAIDQTDPDIDIPQKTEFDFDFSQANIQKVGNLSLSVNIGHQALRDLEAELVAPDGQTRITLWRNRTNAAGGDRFPQGQGGLDGDTMSGTTFTDAAFWSINSSAVNTNGAKAPYLGDYLPEEATPGSDPLYNAFKNLSPAQINGVWKLVITDHRATNTGFLSSATLRIGSGIQNKVGQDRGTPNVVTPAANVLGTDHPTKTAASPTAGIAPVPALAVDSTLGAFSPYQNRIYLAYDGGGSINLLYSDGFDSTGGTLWNTGPIGAGSGYLPQLAVDPTTGTMALAYYTSRYDASATRSTMVLQTLVSGPDYKDRLQATAPFELSPATYVTPHEEVFDQIRSKIITTEPVPSNGTVASDARMWGNSFGLAVNSVTSDNKGRVTLVYPGNLNLNGTQLRTQDIHVAGGPRVVGGDFGPILGEASVTPTRWVNRSGIPNQPGFQPGRQIDDAPIAYNQPIAGGDGRNAFSAFVVTFDRPIATISPNSRTSVFGPSDIKVIFRGPTDDPVGAGTTVPVASVMPLDDIRDPLDDTIYGSKRFLVRLTTPQTAVGTYSYLIGSNTAGVAAQIQDRVRGPVVNYANSGAPKAFTYTGAPDQIQDYTGASAPTTTTITVPPGTFPAGVVVGDVNVRVNITHSNVGDLQLDLISPTGQIIRLANAGDAFGQNFANTVFDDQAGQTLASGTAPYTGSFRPAERLAPLFAANPSGDWQLVVTDLASGDTGVLNNWSITIQGVTQSSSFSTGNFIDQDADGVENEQPFVAGGVLRAPDGFAMPNPTNAGTPFRLPYVVGSLPITIAGPRLVATRVPNQVGASTDNLVLDKPVKAIDLTFDRVINATTFTAADVLRMTGVVSDQFPNGDIPLTNITVTPIDAAGNVLPAGTDSRRFRISGFPEQTLSGTYTIQLSSKIADTDGNNLDTNTNAGVGNLLGTVTGATVQTKSYGGTVSGPTGTGVAIPAKGSVAIPLDIAEGYQLKKASVNISVPFPPNNYRDLEARLVAPDGTTVLLFAKAPQSGPGNMTNITLTDDAFYADPLSGQPRPISPIEDGVQTGGTYNPTQPFQPLIGHGSQGTWKLVIRNLGSQTSGRVSKFVLNLDKPVISSGLGEEVADRMAVSFRIARVDGSQDIARNNWAPVGPAPQIDVNGINSTAGRVSSIAVDPSDPSGNTVYAAGASGGVWRTNNFLTRDPDGPNWVPLADFGPNNALNVGFLAVYNSLSDSNTNGNPNKTVILVGTGSSALNEIDREDQRRFDGVGFLLSEDAGKTWQVLDSTDNFDPVTQAYRPVKDAGQTWTVTTATESGTTATLTTSAPHDVKVGMTVTVSGVSDPGYNGTFAVTAVTPTTISYTAASGLPNATGGTVQAVDRRDHRFVGAVVNKIVFEQNPSAFSNRPIIWAALGRGSTPAADNVAGLWRSMDGGRTWTQVRQGEASDFVLAPGSQLANSGGRPTIGYLAIQGTTDGGAYFIENLDSPAPSFTLMNGGVGRPTVNTGTIGVGASETPNGDFGKITLAVPAFVPGSPLANNYYQRWLYAAVSNPDGTFRGLYMTKDRGYNWTKVRLPAGGGLSSAGPDVDLTLNPNAPGGMHSLALAVDPNDPNIVYFGSNALIKVDTTRINDPYNLTMYSHDDNAGGVRYATSEGVVASDQSGTIVGGGLVAFDPAYFPPLDSFTPSTGGYQGGLSANPRPKWNHLNLDRDPYRPFRRDTALSVRNVSSFTNDGQDVFWNLPGGRFGNGVQDYNWVSQIYSFQDPLTGQARVIVGSDEGIVSYVSNPDGSNMEVNGFYQDFQVPNVPDKQSDLEITGSRNGNIQVARLYSGDAQPSLLAANIASSLLYGAARRLGDVQASPADPSTGTIVWDNTPGQVGRPDTANYVVADKTGTGNVYILRRINDMAPIGDNPVNFFQISKNGGTPVSFTNGLFQSAADAQGLGQWTNQVKTFAVNPVDASGIMMSSAGGRLFLTRDMALNWNAVAEPGTLDGSKATALAFGAPLPTSINLNEYLYYGSENGNIFVSTTGGGNLASSWTNITAGSFGPLDGSPIQKIVPSPTRGSNELFAVTRKGIYHMADWRAPGAAWEDITTNIKTITTLGFGNGRWEVPLLSATDPITTMAVDWRPTYSPKPSNAVLFVGGDGGVFTAVYNADQTTWSRYTGPTTEGAASPGGGLPVVKVTDLDLVLGEIDPSSGRPKPSGSADLLVATTLGRGTWTIGLAVPAGVSGPRVIASTPTTVQTNGFSTVTVTFDKFITASKFTLDDVVLTRPDGTQINPLIDPEDVTPTGAPAATVWKITFPTQTTDGVYTIKVGPYVASGTTNMDQNGNGVNGEPGDAFVMKVVVGRNDLVDYVNDTVGKLLGRVVTTNEFVGGPSSPDSPQPFGTTIPRLVSAREAALQAVVRELLTTYNKDANYNGTIGEARQRLVERLFDNGNAAGEIGHLLPASTGYALTDAERDGLVADLKAGRTSPELIIKYILTKPEYFDSTAAPGAATPATFLDKVYKDLFKGTNVTFDKLPTNLQDRYLRIAETPAGRARLVGSLVNGALVRYDDDGNPSTPLATADFRSHVVTLTYQQLLGRAPTAAELRTGRGLMARPRFANRPQGSEWVYAAVLGSPEFFNRQTQNEGLPDDGLHTNRSWIGGVIAARYFRTAVAGERDAFSQKVMDVRAFQNARTAFLLAVVNSPEYRETQIRSYYNQILGRGPTTDELNGWQRRLAIGASYTGLAANLLGSAEYYAQHTSATDPVAVAKQKWARAVYQTLLSRSATQPEEDALVRRIAFFGRRGASLSVLNSTDNSNGPTYRDGLITAAFQTVLGRDPSAAEREAYQAFLKRARWEFLYVDLMASGRADVDPTTTGIQNILPREFWEIAD